MKLQGLHLPCWLCCCCKEQDGVASQEAAGREKPTVTEGMKLREQHRLYAHSACNTPHKLLVLSIFCVRLQRIRCACEEDNFSQHTRTTHCVLGLHCCMCGQQLRGQRATVRTLSQVHHLSAPAISTHSLGSACVRDLFLV